MLLVGACALLPACLLFTSLDNTTNGGEPAPGEGGTPDVATPDTADTSVTLDATNDATPAADGGFCQTDAGAGQVFCTEFAGAAVSDDWSGLAAGVGSLELAQGNMLAKIPVVAEYEQGKFVYRNIDGAFGTLSCSFAFRRDVLGEEDLSIAELEVQTGGEEYLVALYTRTTGGRLLMQRYPEDGGDGVVSEVPIDLAPAVGEWHRVTVEVGSPQIRVLIDGKLTGSLANAPTPAEIRTVFRLGVPQVDGENTAPWELRFDDVRCILTP
jgi:hypothetical protein